MACLDNVSSKNVGRCVRKSMEGVLVFRGYLARMVLPELCTNTGNHNVRSIEHDLGGRW